MSSSRSLKGIWSVLICLVFMGTVSMAVAKERSSEMMQPGQQVTTGVTAPTDIPGRAGYLQSANKAIGMKVENLQGQRLGSIRDLIVNEERNTVTYALVSEGNKLHPVPWAAFGTGSKTYTLDITKDSLAAAPTIGSSEIDRLRSPDMKRQLEDFYSKQISGTETGKGAVSWIKEKLGGGEKTTSFYKCSTVLGTDIRNPEGKNIARLSDVVFDVRSGKVDYGLARFGGLLRIGSKTAAVPWSAIALNLPAREARLNASVNTLDSAVLAKGDINRLNEPMFASRINETFGRGEVYGYVPPTVEHGLMTSAWLQGSDYNKLFNTNSVTTIEGTVKSIGTFRPERGSTEGLELKIETPTGEKMVIHAGPESYYTSQNIRFSEGDKVSITGSKVKTGFKTFIMASTITRGSDTLKLRDDSGRPLWTTGMIETPPVK